MYIRTYNRFKFIFMKTCIAFSISLFLLIHIAVSQNVHYQHYFNPTTRFESDTFQVQFAFDLSYSQFANIDSVVVIHKKVTSHNYISFTQNMLEQDFVPYNCTYYTLNEEIDEFENTVQTIILKNMQQASFGITINYAIANSTIFQGFLDCPFDAANIETLPSSIQQYLNPTNLIQSQNTEIVAKAQEITQNCVTIADYVEAIVLWNHENISYDFTFNHDVQDAVSVLHNKTAVCEGYSNFTCAMLRSLGIPARYVSGYSVNDQLIPYSYSKGTGEFGQAKGGHAWIEVYYPSIGAWVPTEPQALANFITPAYVPVSNTILQADQIQIKSQIPNIVGTKTFFYKGTTADTIYYGNTVLSRSEPIKPNVTFQPILTLEVGRAHGCNTQSQLPDIAQNIIGSYDVCESSVQTYKVPAIPGATSYEWILPNGTMQTTTDTTLTVVMNSMPLEGLLQVRGKNSFGTGISAQLPIWIKLLPEAYVLSGPDEVCKGHANAEFVINNTGATPHWTVLPGTSGTYSTTKLSLIITNSAASGTVRVYGSNMCGNGPQSNLSVAVLNTTPKPKIENDMLHVCYTDDQQPTVRLRNTYGDVYWLYDGQVLQQPTLTTVKPNSTEPITYMVYQHQIGCVQSDTVSGVIYTGLPLQQPLISLITDSTMTVSTLYSYVWFANAVSYTQQQTIIQPTIEAEFYVLATDEHNCSIQSNTIDFIPPIKNSIPEVANTKPYIFNKIGNAVTVSSGLGIVMECVLYSVTGEKIETKKASTPISFSLHALPKTLYFVEITTSNGVFVERFVK